MAETNGESGGRRDRDEAQLIADPATTQLVISAQAGSAEALEELCRRYLPRVRRIVALKLGRSRRQMQENEEIVQDAFVKILRSLDTYTRISTARFYHWVSRCVVNLIRDRLRARRPDEPLPIGAAPDEGLLSSVRLLVPEDDLTPSRVAEGREMAEIVERALLELPDHQRQLVILRCFCGMSFEEIAATLGFESVSTVRVTLHRVRNELRESIRRLTGESASRD